jgi:hypothetical protein
MSKKQTLLVFSRVGKLSWPENEYIRLAAAAQLTLPWHGSKKAAGRFRNGWVAVAYPVILELPKWKTGLQLVVCQPI